ncbi:MAG: hypothetical protein IMX02_00135 [Limnochordaceae bacterium]|nr:hypothetical protein [Limnochordaceae bacterium]
MSGSARWVRFHVVSWRRLLAWLAVFALGTTAGSTWATVRIGHQVDALARQRDLLEQRAADLEARMEKLQQSLSERRLRPLRSIEVKLAGLDPADELTLVREIRKLLQGLIGRPVDQVDPALVAQILDGRLVSAGGRAVSLALRQVWVTDSLTVWVDVRAALPR